MQRLSAEELQGMVTALKQKSAKGFTLLYDSYAPVLYGVVCRIIKDPALSEDILQEVFVKVWNNIDNYNTAKGAFFTWLMSITRNTTIDYMRSRQFKQSLKIQTITENEYDSENKEKDANMDIAGIYSNIARLEPKYRTIIELVYVQGFTHEETAGLVNLPLGTVKTRARTALQILRKQITK
jgi:RNA polymerase sigma-70 factor (ECF subfamily)